MSDEGQHVRLSGVIHVGNLAQAQAIYVVLVALGWSGGVSMIVKDGDTATTTTLDPSSWRLES